MISCIIVDDEPLAQEVLAGLVRRDQRVQLVKQCLNALEAFEVLHRERIDLVFLDIRMPAISGIDFLRSLKDPPKVIFTTAFSEHAHTAFELDAVDYLVKPVTPERFDQAIRKLLRLGPDTAVGQQPHTYFKVSGKLVKVPHSALMFARSVKDYVQVQTTSGRFLSHMTMKYLADLLPSDRFVRVHRSFLVNRDFIDVADRNEIVIGDEHIPVGENYRGYLR